MNPLGLIRQFVKGLLKENEPWQIGLGIAFGFAIGIIPKANLTAQLIFVLMMCTKANVPFAILSIFLFSTFSPITDKLTDPIGYAVLNLDFLYPLFLKLYNMPILPWTDFNNTVVLGGLISGTILFYPVYLIGKKFGELYKKTLREKMVNSKMAKFLAKNPIWVYISGIHNE